MQLTETYKNEFITNVCNKDVETNHTLSFHYKHLGSEHIKFLPKVLVNIIAEYCADVYIVEYKNVWNSNKLKILITCDLLFDYILYVRRKNNGVIQIRITFNNANNDLFTLLTSKNTCSMSNTEKQKPNSIFIFNVIYLINAFMLHELHIKQFIKTKHIFDEYEYTKHSCSFKPKSMLCNIDGHYMYNRKEDITTYHNNFVIYNNKQFKLMADIIKILIDTIIEKLKI